MNGLLRRLRKGLGFTLKLPVQSGGGPPADRIAEHFKRLKEVAPGLPAKVARFVIHGDNSSILVTIQGNTARTTWQRRGSYYPPRDEAQIFANPHDWNFDQMQRLGEAIAALQPITYNYGFFGSKKSPDWLRHVVALWLGHDRKEGRITTLLALAEKTGQGTASVLDIVFGPDATNFRSSNSVHRLVGVHEWLDGARDEVRVVSGGLDADQRAELVATIGRFKLHDAYLDLLVDGATGSSKKVRTAARQALSGADAVVLADALRVRFQSTSPGRQVELVEVAALTLGETAVPLLAEWGRSEISAKVRATLDRVSGAVAPVTTASKTDRPSPWHVDGPQGYVAVDGSWIDVPPQEPLPEPGAMPPETLHVLDPVMAEFNRLLAVGQAEAAASEHKHWHWSRHHTRKGPRDLEHLAELAEGTHLKPNWSALDWLRLPQLKHPAVSAFLNDPGLSLSHLVRLAVATSNGHIAFLFGDWGGPIGTAIQHRIEKGADIRTILQLWLGAGGTDHIKDYLSRGSYGPLPDLGAPLWPVLCQRFAQLDEALGLVPQSGGKSMEPLLALELLGMFPSLPERYRGPLMLLATDSSARLRQGARTLLRQTPAIGSAIALQLQDSRQDARALAAEWLAARNEVEQVPVIRQALGKERSDRARAAMITALERLNEDVSEYFDRPTLVKDAKAGLAKAQPKGLEWLQPYVRLLSLQWKDGTPVDPLLPEWWSVLAVKLKQPGGNALINLWLDRLSPRDAQRLGWTILTGWIDEDTRTPTDEEANAHAALHVDATLRQHIGWAKQYPQSADYWPTDRAVVFEALKRQKAGTYLGSAADSKGVLALATRVAGADAAQRVRAFLKDHGSRVSQAKALLELLAAIGTGPALQLLLSAANRSKQRSVQAHAAALIAEVAEHNGWSPAQLADRTVPTGGFDTDGTQELDCGTNRSYRLQLDARDAVIILNADGREVKALPGPRIDDERPAVEAAKKQLATARNEVKQVLTAQTERLQEAMCLQRSWTRGDWESFVAGHPIVGRVATRLVWQGVDAGGQPVATFRPLGDGSNTDATDGEVDLAEIGDIRLAHSSLLDEGSVAAWRAHLADYAVEPPFDQLGRDLPQLEEGQGVARTITDREGWMIDSFKLRGIATKLGYQRGQAQDGGWFLTYEKTYHEAGLVAEIEFTGSPLPEASRPTALQSMSFRKLRGSGGQVPLADVPPVLRAECWRDLHDIAAKGMGFDPEWQKKAYV
ncbi:MAG: DUF4132 domain-containing protein [Devosia nanyangense]|uniref:DUF4132 domain-containing protein n=1 Tax=Devosia nanyangense TaxID=1228055 RepID=A0A933NWV5_9HYPH|nr:DUF4132 domain-containing protein [Devosia nanyangense]